MDMSSADGKYSCFYREEVGYGQRADPNGTGKALGRNI